MKNKLIIVAGCSGSGKSYISKTIKDSFRKGDAQIVCMDWFYKPYVSMMPKVKKSGNTNFDHPNALDWKLLKKCLYALLNNKSIYVPMYDYITHRRIDKKRLVKPTKIIIFDGFLALYDDEINKKASLKLFVDTSLDECFIRRLKRDRVERNREVEDTIRQWSESVKPMYDMYVKPRRWVSDFLIPWDKHNNNSIKFLIAAIKSQLKH